MASFKLKRRECFLVILILMFFFGVIRPLLFGPGYKKYVELSQQEKLDRGDVVLLVVGEKNGGYMDYRLLDVWRNRHGTRIQWHVGDRITELREIANEAVKGITKRVVFYETHGNKLNWLGSFLVINDQVSINLDIGTRDFISRLLNRPVPLTTLQTYIQQESMEMP